MLPFDNKKSLLGFNHVLSIDTEGEWKYQNCKFVHHTIVYDQKIITNTNLLDWPEYPIITIDMRIDKGASHKINKYPEKQNLLLMTLSV